MGKMTFEFTMDDTIAMAKFVAELVRQGVVFDVEYYSSYWLIKLTGGY